MRIEDVMVGDEVWIGINSRKVESINGYIIRLSGLESCYNARDLDPVFEYGEEISCSDDGKTWANIPRNFVAYQPKHNEPFITIGLNSCCNSWKYARKIRKEEPAKYPEGVSIDIIEKLIHSDNISLKNKLNELIDHINKGK